MTAAAIAVRELGKRYVIAHRDEAGDRLSSAMEAAIRSPLRWARQWRDRASRRREEFWALRDVSFSVAHGEAVGVVGRNGAGKSTLLKLLSRITEPTTGEIRYRGRVTSLLEVGTGFHPDLTGRENIYLNAAILGMRRAEIARRFDEIVAFSEVERVLDTPVKRYSSGMYVRLAFGVAAHLEPEILLVDEVLAVGDAAFQKKCLGKMGSVVAEGRTVLLVSHTMAAVSSLCSRALLIEGGCLRRSGAPKDVIDEYLAGTRSLAETALAARADRLGDGRVRFVAVTVCNRAGEPAGTLRSGEDAAFHIELDLGAQDSIGNVVVQIKFTGSMGQPLFACLTRAACAEPLTLRRGRRLVCRIPRLPLASGKYTYSVWCKVGEELADLVSGAGTLDVEEGDFYGTGRLPPTQVGEFLVEHTWTDE